MLTKNDNWGSAARFGMFIVGNEAVPEAEWWAMLPRNISVHAARVMARAPWAHWNADRTGVELADDIVRGCEQFGAMRLAAITVGHSSSSILGGKGWDEAVIAAMTKAIGSAAAITTNGLDSLAALCASDVRRPFLVLPPWFNEATVAAGVRYYADHGIAPAAHLSYDPGPKWRGVPTGEMYPRGLGFEQEIEPLYEQITSSCPDAADGVLIAGTGFRCVALIDALENELQRPVLTANQVSLWHCLKLAGVSASISGYGRLFEL